MLNTLLQKVQIHINTLNVNDSLICGQLKKMLIDYLKMPKCSQTPSISKADTTVLNSPQESLDDVLLTFYPMIITQKLTPPLKNDISETARNLDHRQNKNQTNMDKEYTNRKGIEKSQRKLKIPRMLQEIFS